MKWLIKTVSFVCNEWTVLSPYCVCVCRWGDCTLSSHSRCGAIANVTVHCWAISEVLPFLRCFHCRVASVSGSWFQIHFHCRVASVFGSWCSISEWLPLLEDTSSILEWRFGVTSWRIRKPEMLRRSPYVFYSKFFLFIFMMLLVEVLDGECLLPNVKQLLTSFIDFLNGLMMLSV